MKIFKDTTRLVMNWLLPEICLSCHKNGGLLCENCYQLIHFHPTPTHNILFANEFLGQTFILAAYQPPISDLIKGLKYQRLKRVSVVLAELLYQHLFLNKHDLITWAPTSKKRVNERGFNQAELIAQQLTLKTQIPAWPLLIKTKHTHKQARSSFQERLANLQNNFMVNAEYAEIIKNKKILIVDDVMSTGSTLNECAKILKQAGAGEVSAVAVAQS